MTVITAFDLLLSLALINQSLLKASDAIVEFHNVSATGVQQRRTCSWQCVWSRHAVGAPDAVEGRVAAMESCKSRGILSELGTAQPRTSLLYVCVQLRRLELPSQAFLYRLNRYMGTT